MALSNGSLKGDGQTREYDGSFRTPGDFLIDFDASVYFQILGFKFKTLNLNLELKTNPNGNGHFYKRNRFNFVPRIELYWFGARINMIPEPLLTKNLNASFVLPYCTNAGGVFDFPLQPGARSFRKGFDAFFVKLISQNNGNGLYEFVAQAGIPWLSNRGASYRVYSDGFHFNFIPVQSALDYGTPGTFPLNHDIENENIYTKLSRVPFDVINGIPTSINPNSTNHFKYNRSHMYVRNTSIGEVASCPGQGVMSYILNKEIGDEELWLDNMILIRTDIYEAKLDIYINDYNNWYEYPNRSGKIGFEGIYSKEDAFIISDNHPYFDPIFIYSRTFTYLPPFSQPYVEQQQSVPSCCIKYISNKNAENEAENHTDVKENRLNIYPNPANDKIMVNYSFVKNDEVTLSIYNQIGQKIFSENYINDHFSTENQVSLNLSAINLTEGLYICTVTNGSKYLIKKFCKY